MIRRHVTALRLVLMAADGMSAIVLFVAISMARSGDGWAGRWTTAGIRPDLAMFLFGAGWVGVLWALGLYRLRVRLSIRAELLDVLRAATLLGLATFSVLFIVKLPDVSRLLLLYLFGAQIGVTIASRVTIRLILTQLRNHGHNTRYLLIVGAGLSARRFADRVERHRELGLRVIGHLVVPSDSSKSFGRPILGTIDDIEGVLHGRIVDEVAICVPAADVGLVEPIARLCEEEGKVVRIPLVDYAVSLPGGRLEEFGGTPILSLVYGPDRVLGLIIKRLIDVALATIALIVLSPLFLLIALAIAIRDGRPVFFRQTRVGLHGRPFRVVKFRTMIRDAEAVLAELESQNEIKGHAFKLTNDPRLSKTGRFLRSSSFDELPQLLNVLIGQMSLVGPRPPLPREVAVYDLWHRRRLSMKPGMTGLWQVQARREGDFDRWVELDLAYIDRWSIWLDLNIMARTIPAMMQGR
jgi:exopolysaccharide biosynthesis polyprenyl glycosylphosphotransferase